MLTKQEIKNKQYLKVARRLNKQGILYPSVIKLAEELNVSEILIPQDLEHEAIKIAKKVLNWIDKHDGKYPKQNSKDKTEKQYATWIQNQKRAKQGNSRGIYYKSVYKIFEKKYHNIFDVQNLEQQSVKTASNVLNWIEDHGGKCPSQHSSDKVEKQYATWISHQKRAKQGKKGYTYYESVYKIFAKKYPRIFDTLEEQSIEKAKEVFNWIDKHGGNYPKQGSKDPIEKQYVKWIQHQKRAKQGKGNGNIYYESVYNVFEKEYPRIFDTLEEKAIEKAREVFNWIKDHDDNYPKERSKDQIEKQYASWIGTQKQAKQGKGHGNKYYKSVYKIFEKKYPHIFDVRS
jgi:plasmid stabilization system protein ParE